jgi:hypothetical protein
VVDVLGLARAGQHQREPAPPHILEQLRHPVEGLDLPEHRIELVGPVGAQLVAEPLFDVIADDSGHQLITAHPDRPVQPPDRNGQVAAAERSEPGQRVVVVRVDERAVDVEDRSVVLRRRVELPAPATGNRPEPTWTTAASHRNGRAARLSPVPVRHQAQPAGHGKRSNR